MAQAGVPARSPLAVLALGLAWASWRAAEPGWAAGGRSGPWPPPPPAPVPAPEGWCPEGAPAWLEAVCPPVPECPACPACACPQAELPGHTPGEQLALILGPSVLTNVIGYAVSCWRQRGRVAAGYGAPPVRRGGGMVQ